MSKKVGMGVKTEQANKALAEDNGKALQVEVDKLRKERKKIVEDNKVLKKELEGLKEQASVEEQKTVDQAEGKA